MSNFYRDNQDIHFHLQNEHLKAVVKMHEDDFTVEDAIDNYHRVLEIVGDIAGEFIAPRASEVDRDGATFSDGEVKFAKGTQEELDCLTKSELMGFTLPRRYGGLNMPKTVYSAAIEMVSRADAALMNLFGLQEIGDTILRFGTEDQKERYLPRFSRGEVLGSMALTEPNAGSDLQAVGLKAFEDENGEWRLNGVKRFITNGCAHISLVLANSEKNSSGGRALSLFIYERDKDMAIRRIEHKLGIHGSPTCEMQFNNSKAELLGQRRFGLIKYTMALMNGARLAVSAQAIGIAEAAYREADSYSQSRVQFGKSIRNLPPVYEMLTDMKVSIEAGRTLLYETSRIVDMKENLENKADAQDELKYYTKLAALFTPALKTYATEMSNKVCYDALQVHGGNGYTQDYAVERHFRDARITNIYEGTTQLQIIAAIGGVVSGVVNERLDWYEAQNDFSKIDDIFAKAKRLRIDLDTAIACVKDKKDPIFQEYNARRLVEIATCVIISYLLCIDALRSDRKKIVADYFINKANAQIKGHMEYILSSNTVSLDFHEAILSGL